MNSWEGPAGDDAIPAYKLHTYKQWRKLCLAVGGGSSGGCSLIRVGWSNWSGVSTGEGRRARRVSTSGWGGPSCWFL